MGTNCTTLRKNPTKTTKQQNAQIENIYLDAITLVQKHFRLYLFRKNQKQILQSNLIRKLQTPQMKFSSICKNTFKNIIRNKIKEVLNGMISFDNLERYTFGNYHELLLDTTQISEKEVFSQFKSFRFKLEPLMITNLSNPSDIEFYWGEWNSAGKKEGFGIKIFSNGNFYFGTFKDNKMHGLGLYAYADKSSQINLFEIKNKENLFKIKSSFSKNYSDLEVNNFEGGAIPTTTIDEELKQCFVKNLTEQNEYFLYIGQFSKNKFEGFGEIYDKIQSNYCGRFKANKLVSDGKFKFRRLKRGQVC